MENLTPKQRSAMLKELAEKFLKEKGNEKNVLKAEEIQSISDLNYNNNDGVSNNLNNETLESLNNQSVYLKREYIKENHFKK